MTKAAKIDLPKATKQNDAETQYLPLADLKLSTLNPRQGALPEGDVETLAESIKVLGLIQNLSGWKAKGGKKVEIVAGGRRLRALQYLAKSDPDHPAVQSILVNVTTDKMVAEAWANAENTARADLDPADEIRAYGRMVETGAPVETIATAFAVTEAHVKGRLKLAKLPDGVLDALKAKTINLDTAKAFTLCDDAKRIAEALAKIESGDIDNQNQLRRMLTNQAVKQSDRRAIFVGIKAYEAAGGTLTRDLFSEDVFLESEALLSDLFAKAMEDAADKLEADGWKWTQTLENSHVSYYDIEQSKCSRLYKIEGELSEAEAEEYDALAELVEGDAITDEGQARLEELELIRLGDFSAEQRALSGGFVYVGSDGMLKFEAGFVKPEDKQAAYDAEVLAKPHSHGGSSSDTPKSPYSQALAADLTAIRLAAAQTALLEKPEFVLDLLAFFMSPASGHWSGILGLRTDPERDEPAEEDQNFTLHPRLGGPKPEAEEDADEEFEYRSIDDLSVEFAAFREQGKKHRNATITERMARLLKTPNKAGFMEGIEAEIGADVRSIWTPTKDNFFGRVRGPYLIALWCELLELDPKDGSATYFTKLKAKEKAEEMHKLFAFDPDLHRIMKVTKDQADRIRAWVPDCMA